MPSIKFLLCTCLVMISIFIRYLSEIRATWYRRSIHAVIYFKCHQVNHRTLSIPHMQSNLKLPIFLSIIENFVSDGEKILRSALRPKRFTYFSFIPLSGFLYFPRYYTFLFSADPFMLNRISPFLLTSPQILQKKRRKENRKITVLWRGKAVQSSIILLLSDQTLPRFSSMCVHKLSRLAPFEDSLKKRVFGSFMKFLAWFWK